MLRFDCEKFQDLLPELLSLFEKQYNELAPYSDIKLAPDYARYATYCEHGLLKCFTARLDQKLIGYCFFIIGRDLHYRKSIRADQDIIYIDKSHRGFGSSFIDWCDVQLKGLGVQVVEHHCKVFADWGALLERKGYKKMNITYSKRLDLEV